MKSQEDPEKLQLPEKEEALLNSSWQLEVGIRIKSLSKMVATHLNVSTMSTLPRMTDV